MFQGFHQFHQQQASIPEWFLEMRRNVYEELHKYIGTDLTPSTLDAIESRVNGLLERWEKEYPDNPILHDGHNVKAVRIDKHTKNIQLIF